jgi:hypothetical protein
VGVLRELNGFTSQSIAVQIGITIRIGLALGTNGEALARVNTISTNVVYAGCVCDVDASTGVMYTRASSGGERWAFSQSTD